LCTVRVRRATSLCFFFQAEDGIRDRNVTGVQTCALPILRAARARARPGVPHRDCGGVRGRPSGGRLARVRAALAGPGRGRRRNPFWRDQRGVGRDQALEDRGQAAAGGQRDPASGLDVLRGGARPPKPLICAFTDEMRAEGYAVESILRVLRQQGLEIAARTYRAWRRPARIADRTVTDALVEDKVRDLAWKVNPVTGRREMTPEGLYGR